MCLLQGQIAELFVALMKGLLISLHSASCWISAGKLRLHKSIGSVDIEIGHQAEDWWQHLMHAHIIHCLCAC